MKLVTLTCAALLLATAAQADWKLDGDASTLGFVTTKNGDTAESHMFSGLSGSVNDAGAATVEIPLASVETFIDIRNERMREFLFDVASYPIATISTDVDLEKLQMLADGQRAKQEIELTIATNGTETSYYADVNVTNISDNMVTVSTVRPIITYAEDMGYEDGVAKLQELAGLESIDASVPVTFDLVFRK